MVMQVQSPKGAPKGPPLSLSSVFLFSHDSSHYVKKLIWQGSHFEVNDKEMHLITTHLGKSGKP